jgi:hypothetical protein
LLHEQASILFDIQPLRSCWNQDDTLTQLVNNDAVMPSRRDWQLGYEIHADFIPAAVWYGQGLYGTRLLLVAGFVLLALRAAGNILGNAVRHARPEELTLQHLQQLIFANVTTQGPLCKKPPLSQPFGQQQRAGNRLGTGQEQSGKGVPLERGKGLLHSTPFP